MKILQLVQSFLPTIGGAQIVVHHLSNALVARGHEVVVLAAGRGDAEWTREASNAFPARYSIRTYDFGLRFGEALGRNRRSILRAMGSLRREWGFDLVHAHTLYYPGYCALEARRLWGVPAIVTEHGTFALMRVDRALPTSRSVQRKMLATVREAPCLTAPGREAFDVLMAERPAGTALDLSRVLPNGVAVPSSERMPMIVSSTTREPAQIVMVGRNDPVKGYDTALQAFALLRSQRADARLIVTGDGTKVLEEEARRLGVAPWVDLLPARFGEDLWRTYASAGVFWLTSRRESFGLTKFEAMCFGLPGAFNDAPGVREDIRDGENGLLFRENDPADLAAKTARLIGDASLSRRLSAAARKTGDLYRWENLIGVYEALYAEAIGAANG